MKIRRIQKRAQRPSRSARARSAADRRKHHAPLLHLAPRHRRTQPFHRQPTRSSADCCRTLPLATRLRDHRAAKPAHRSEANPKEFIPIRTHPGFLNRALEHRLTESASTFLRPGNTLHAPRSTPLAAMSNAYLFMHHLRSLSGEAACVLRQVPGFGTEKKTLPALQVYNQRTTVTGCDSVVARMYA